ncbi:hypothetical protein MMYC01_201560 [Madurella mycetomatis]|uniref:Microbial-type PARG catalytic domain-containing protein n=1 Tax=Madurella mycetomatis TaxID=100816 RepID=A0A175WEV2_9PEZI|nr:hypothetical protein MMYC01_207593 [Madurella mycetomatis]KXX82082.1 hypothetical protein MMYC01_201560 [Madurella mycetomatis]
MWKRKYYQNPRRLALAAIAKETQETTPTIAAGLPHMDPTNSEKIDLETLPALDATKCPRFKVSESVYGTTVRVFNQDSFDAAIAMPSSILGIRSKTATQAAENEILDHLRSYAAAARSLNSTASRVAVLNMASEVSPGGGWLKGATAQEEALCYRSSLAASLHRSLYPIAPRAGVYTRDVVIFRGSVSDGHKLMVPETAVENLPVVSVLSVAGIRRPEVREVGVKEAGGTETSAKLQDDGESGEARKAEKASNAEQADKLEVGEPAGSDDSQGKGKRKDQKGKRTTEPKTPKGPMQFAHPADRALTKDKMRLCLRMAATKGHTMLVLGALGCGAFKNPPQEIANCWMEVLSGEEVAGGWFKEIWFAVYDRRNEGNFEIFKDMFDGKVVCEVKTSS